jgi:ribonuclease VapC
LIFDTSAIVAVVTNEPIRRRLVDAIALVPRPGAGSATLFETGLVLVSRFGPSGRTALTTFCQEFGVDEVTFGTDHRLVALDAFQKFGKGRHPAALNFGDCMSYATARVARQPLLCIGNDFAQTDLELVPLG